MDFCLRKKTKPTAKTTHTKVTTELLTTRLNTGSVYPQLDNLMCGRDGGGGYN